MTHDIDALPLWSRQWALVRLQGHRKAGHEVSRDEWTGLRDWLASLPVLRPKMVGKLHKLTMVHALGASYRWHTAMAARSTRLAHERAGFGGDPDAVELVSPAHGLEGWRWVRVTSPLGLDYEGAAMGHCVGQGGYDCDKTILSLRDPQNMPHCTIEWNPDTRSVLQVQGKANGVVVERYHGTVAHFVHALQPLEVRNPCHFGHVDLDGHIVHWRELGDDVVVKGELELGELADLVALPTRLKVGGNLYLSGCPRLASLPKDLWVGGVLYINGCPRLDALPTGLHVVGSMFAGRSGLRVWPQCAWIGGNIDIHECPIQYLPPGLHVHGSLTARGSGLRALPTGMVVDGGLALCDSLELTTIHSDLHVGECLDLCGCNTLASLPQTLSHIGELRLRHCVELKALPAAMTLASLDVQGCHSLESLPDGLHVQDYLNINDCPALKFLPRGLKVGSYLYMQGCPLIKGLPDDLLVEGEIVDEQYMASLEQPVQAMQTPELDAW